MKKYISLSAISLIFTLLVGCGKEQENINQEFANINIKLYSEQTKGIVESTPTRYIVEAYAQVNGQKMVVARYVANDGNIEFRLPYGTFDFYCWADMGEEYYNAADLRCVTMKDINLPLLSANKVCFAGQIEGCVVDKNSVNIGTTINRPVAKVNYINRSSVKADEKVNITYSSVPLSYDVLSKSYSSSQGILNSVTSYDFQSSTQEPFTVDYIFPTNSVDITVNFDESAENTNLFNIPVEVNKQTNIYANFQK